MSERHKSKLGCLYGKVEETEIYARREIVPTLTEDGVKWVRLEKEGGLGRVYSGGDPSEDTGLEWGFRGYFRRHTGVVNYTLTYIL